MKEVNTKKIIEENHTLKVLSVVSLGDQPKGLAVGDYVKASDFKPLESGYTKAYINEACLGDYLVYVIECGNGTMVIMQDVDYIDSYNKAN